MELTSGFTSDTNEAHQQTCKNRRLVLKMMRGLFCLTSLVTWQLRATPIEGSLPHGVGSLTHMALFELRETSLRGPLPNALWSCTQLQQLQLSSSWFAGSLPQAVAALKKLTGAYLSDNDLTGTLPDAFGILSGLTWLHLEDNRLTGTIPGKYAFHGFQRLLIGENSLEGTLPEQLRNLRLLSCPGMRLEGQLPQKVPEELTVLVAHQNYLTGRVNMLRWNLQVAAMHGNRFNQISDLPPTVSSNDGNIMLHLNDFSCAVPRLQCYESSGSQHPSRSLIGIGNHFTRPDHFPRWIEPHERDGLFWVSQHEGRALLPKVVAGYILPGKSPEQELELLGLEPLGYTGHPSLRHISELSLQEIGQSVFVAMERLKHEL